MHFSSLSALVLKIHKWPTAKGASLFGGLGTQSYERVCAIMVCVGVSRGHLAPRRSCLCDGVLWVPFFGDVGGCIGARNGMQNLLFWVSFLVLILGSMLGSVRTGPEIDRNDFQTVQDGPKIAKESPKMDPRSPKTAPRCPKMLTGLDASKMAPR